MPYTIWTLVILTKHAPHSPLPVYWKFQCWFLQVWHKTWLHIIAFFHFHDTHTKTASQKTALKLAWWCQQVETHTRSLWDIYLPFTWRESPQCCQIMRYAGSLITLFTDHVQWCLESLLYSQECMTNKSPLYIHLTLWETPLLNYFTHWLNYLWLLLPTTYLYTWTNLYI